MRASTGGVLATKSERKILASTCLYSLYAWFYFFYSSFTIPTEGVERKLLILICRSRCLDTLRQVLGLDLEFLGKVLMARLL